VVDLNYSGRITKVREELSRRNLECLFIGPDANMEYLTGVPRHWPGNTKQRQNSLEYAGLLVTEKDVVVFVPRLTGLTLTKYIDQYPVVTQLVNFPDSDLQGHTFVDVCRQLGLSGKRAGIIQDVSSSVILLLANKLGMTFENADIILQFMRAVKDSEEISLMKKASAITDEIYLDIVRQLIPGVAILEIEREIARLCLARGARCTSFPSRMHLTMVPKPARQLVPIILLLREVILLPLILELSLRDIVRILGALYLWDNRMQRQ